MPTVRLRFFAATVALALMFLPFFHPGKAQHNATEIYAITNARIVTVAGQVIERGTIVVRNGLIADVGANVSAPADARTIDGTGLIVYPGLIDSYTSLGIPEPSPTPSPTGGPGGGF